MSTNWLKTLREEVSLSQEELTTRLQLEGITVTRGAISGWETSRYNPPLDNPDFRRVLAHILEISVPELLKRAGYEIDSNNKSEAARKAADIVDNLSPSDQKLAIDLLSALAHRK